jgi:integrase
MFGYEAAIDPEAATHPSAPRLSRQRRRWDQRRAVKEAQQKRRFAARARAMHESALAAVAEAGLSWQHGGKRRGAPNPGPAPKLTSKDLKRFHREFPTPERHLCAKPVPVADGEFLGRYRPDFFVPIPQQLRERWPELFPTRQRSFGRDRAAALHFVTRIILPSLRRKPGSQSIPMLLRDFETAFLNAMAEEPKPKGLFGAGGQRSASTIARKRTAFHHLCETERPDGARLGDLPPADLVEEDIVLYRQRLRVLGMSMLSQKNLFSDVRTLISWLRKRHIVPPGWESPLPDDLAALVPVVPSLAPRQGMRLCNTAQVAMLYGRDSRTIHALAQEAADNGGMVAIPWTGEVIAVVKALGHWWYYVPKERVDPFIRARMPASLPPGMFGESLISLEELDWAFEKGLPLEPRQIQLMLRLQQFIGARAQELAGLRECDVILLDPDDCSADYPLYTAVGDAGAPAAILWMRHQWSSSSKTYKPTKNLSLRTLFLSREALDIVRELLVIANGLRDEAKRKRGRWLAGDGELPLFCSANGTPRDPQELNDALARTLLRAGFPDVRSIELARLHGIRHLVGYLYYLASGCDEVATARLLGDTPATVLRYYLEPPTPDQIQADLKAQAMVVQARNFRKLAEGGELRSLRMHVEMARDAAAARDVGAVSRLVDVSHREMDRVREYFGGEPPSQLQRLLESFDKRLSAAVAFAQRSRPDDGAVAA